MTATPTVPSTTPEVPGRLAGAPVRQWYRDTLSCLQSTFATVLLHGGHDPLEVLGAHWEFLYKPGDVRLEEFYYPCRHPEDLGRSLAPHHPVSSRWRHGGDTPDGRDGREPLDELTEAVAAGELRIAAVDNYHLPFRPAYHDVHAAHLVVVFGIDRRRGLVHVSDAQPPAYSGPIRIEDFENAWAPPSGGDDGHFFSDTAMARRTLTVRLGEPAPALTGDVLFGVLGANLELLAREDDEAGWTGLDGLRRFTEQVVERARGGDRDAVAEVYAFGWGPQAQASLHGELLRRWGADHGAPEVAEAGRLVDHAAHLWTGLRVTCAHGEVGSRASGTAADLRRHARRLRAAYEAAGEGLERAREAL